MTGSAVASWTRKRWPPSNRARRVSGIARAKNSLLVGGATPSKRPPQTSVGHVIHPSRADVSCRARAPSWFARPGPGSADPGSRDPVSIRSAIRATGGRAGQDQPADPLGMADRDLLGHHAAEGHSQHEAVLPADGVEENGCVVGQAGPVALVTPGARDAQEWIPRPLQFVVQGHAVGVAPGHALTVATRESVSPGGPSPRSVTNRTVRIHRTHPYSGDPDESRRQTCCSRD
jgi:hypothetical protein